MPRPSGELSSPPCSEMLARYKFAGWGMLRSFELVEGIALPELVSHGFWVVTGGLDRLECKWGLGCGSGTHGLHSRTFSPPPSAGFEPALSVSSVKSIVSAGVRAIIDLA